MPPTRRIFLAAGAAALSVPAFAWAQAGGDKKLVLIILRGGLDGLAALPPIGDPDYVRARGRLAIENATRLDDTFALHPALTSLAELYRAGELLPIHACATAYRERSHFDAQNVLETGAVRPFARDTGWLNAALTASAPTGARERGLAISQQAPLVLRGDAPVATWSPSTLPEPSSDTMSRLLALYQARDPALAAALQGAMNANAMVEGGANGGARAPETLARAAANFMRAPDGPSVVVLEMSGWDTHANQGLDQGALARNLRALNATVLTFKTELGPVWRDTAVVIVTEFGRTVAPNGGGGTDHGTAAAAFLAGGAIAGGRVLADWPGLSRGALYEGRDLRPTLDLRGVMKGVLSDHLRVSDGALALTVFPDSASIPAISGLIRS